MKKIKPLQDRILVKRLEEKEPEARHHHPGHGQREAPGRRSHRRGSRQVTDDGAAADVGEWSATKILFGKYSGSEVKLDERGVPDHARGGRPRHSAVAVSARATRLASGKTTSEACDRHLKEETACQPSS